MNEIFGKNLGQYMLLEQLGEGGMAKVYNAYDPRVERNVAIKVILPSKRSSKYFLQQFEMEAKSTANLSHTNIVKVLDYGTQDGQPYLVMEFIPGGTLKESMQGPIPWEKAAAILAPIARALDYVHKQQIVHRDVKPSNILIDENFQPMLSDFGVVKLLETKDQIDNSVIGVGVGTPEYMSPEQGMGKQIDYRADIYSLGLVFYELVTGRKPFVADTPMALVIKHVTDEILLPSKINGRIPDFVDSVILRAVAKDPEKRFPDMGQFSEALELLAQGKKKNRKKILDLANYQRKKVGTIPLIFGLSLFLIVGLYMVSSYFNLFELYSIPIKSVYELGIFSSNVKKTNPQPTIYTTLIYQENVVLITATPSKNQKSTQELTSQFGGKPQPTPTKEIITSSETNLVLAGTEIPSYASISNSEIARWGIGAVNAINWTQNGETIVLGTSSGLFIYNAQTKDLQNFINPNTNVKAINFDYLLNGVIIGGENGNVSEWDMTSGQQIRSFNYVKPKSERIGEGYTGVTSIDVSEKSQIISVGYDNGVLNVYDLDSGNLIFSEDQYPTVKDIKISNDGRFLYVSNGEKKIIIWEISRKENIGEIELTADCTSMAISNSGKFILCGSSARIVNMVDLTDARVVYNFSNLGSSALNVSFSSDDSKVAVGLQNGQIKIFNRPETTQYFSVLLPIIQINGHPDPVRGIAFSPKNDDFISASWLGGLKEWDGETGESLFSLDQSMPAVKKLLFSPNGKWLVSSHDMDYVYIWQVSDGTKKFTYKGYLPDGDPISPNNSYLSIIIPPQTNGEKIKIQVINLEDGSFIKSMTGYEPGWFVGFSPNSDMMVTGNANRAIIWDVSTWERIYSHGGPNEGCGQFFTRQNERLVMISRYQILYDYNERIIKNICNRPQSAGPYITDETSYANGVINRNLFKNSDYQFVGTGIREFKLVALGSKFGSIHIYKIP